MREVKAIPGKETFLGRIGENLATVVKFDISEWQKTYGDGTVYVLHQRNGDKQPYPCANERDGDFAIWRVFNADVAVAGRGRAELQYYKGDVLVKSETFTTVVERALGTPTEDAPPPYEGWLENILGVATEAQVSAREAAESAEAAEQSKVAAVNSANVASSSAAAASISETNAKASEMAVKADTYTAKSAAENAYEYSAAARDYMAEADGSRKAAVEAAIEAQAHANSIVGDKEAAAASAASAKASASEAAASKAAAAASAAEAKAAVYDAARDAAAEVEAELVERVADHVAAAERAEELARNAANESVLNQQAAQTHARTASNHADRAIEAVNDALDAQSAAERAQAAAEAAAKDAQQAAGGDFATPAYVDNKVAESEYNVCQYVDLKIANVPTPDVSGQIDAHNTDSNAHADIRNMIQNIPVPDVSAQINAHNTNSAAHADIREMAESAGTLAASAQADATNALRDADYAWREAMGKASIFYCYSDSTTLDEIDEQVENGNIIILDEAGRYVPMVSGEYGTSYLFRGAVDDATIISASIDYDGWTVFEKSIMPEDHASDEDTYGLGSGIYYGHVKLSDAVNSSNSSSTGTAATPVAVKTAYDKAVAAQNAVSTHNSNASAHSDIRTAVSNAATAASNAASAASAAQTTANSKATTATYTVSVPTGWTANSTGGYYKTVAVSGMLATDNPIADVVLGADVDANAAYIEAWSLVTRISTAANSITLYANGDAPATAFTVQLKAVR